MVAALAGDAPIIGLEPSCLLTLRDEYPALLPGEASGVAERALLIGEFLDRARSSAAVASGQRDGACARALSSEVVRRVCAGAACAEPDSRADGEADRVVMLRHGRNVWLPGGYTGGITRDGGSIVAAGGAGAGADDIIVADGTSCRHQIRDLADRQAVHAVQVLARALPA